MKKINFLIILIFLYGHLYSQNMLKIGDKAPKVNITDYILNIPNDKNIENKYIILEFWATWCAPCLGAVPHLNELQNKFKNRKDLYFFSLTYEKPDKIKRTLEKVEFKTIVVSDQTKKTEASFNVEGIPHTVLIDNKGIIKWIGEPNELNTSMIENLLSGKNILTEKIELKTEKKEEIEAEKKESENNTDVVLGFLKDKNTHYIFSLINANKNDYGMAIEAFEKGKYIDLNNNLKSILAKIIKKPEFQIIIKDDLIEKKYNLLYKNSNKVDTDVHIKILKTNLLNALDLAESIETKKVEVYNLKVKNVNKLSISIKEDDDANHISDNDTHFVFSNSKIETLIKEIGNYQKIIIFNETGLNDNLDFIIRKGNLKELSNDLEEYGLILEKFSKEIDFYNYK
ncbi:Thioredoxin domain-containing protein [Flavobacterium branchiophilum]|uniref:Thioredoxin family protein n=1 Tax=Flavobacterium branchiophilum (strain FL-15) TaxID=1034807 RepID=G2Z0S6_FLABF|nr:TlpA disulfide reductase family protein [Flavobacterium branchiophilum]CCB69471.1 Thioredoxin family protein [Flavobacterium branchiophilum FL-15]